MDVEGERGGEPFDHVALFYRDMAEYVAVIIPFVRDGVAAGEPVAASVPKQNLQLLEAALGGDAANVRLLDMTEVGRNPGRILADVLHAIADPYPDHHVRIVGEPIWPNRTELEYPACLQHEALINESFRGRQMTLLCPYDASRLPRIVLADAEQTHPDLIRDGRRVSSGHFDPARALAKANAPLPETDAQPLVFDGSTLSVVRRAAYDAARRAGLSDDRADDFVLAIGELAANSIQHGGGSGQLRLWIENGAMVGEVADGGRLRDPLTGRRHPDHNRLGGRGLPLVNHVADLVRTVTGNHGMRTRVYMQM